jgi:RNA polymerase sigma-70 factor, ECF subfamily
LATRDALSTFLQQVEQKAYRRALFHVRDADAALDIVQDSMIKLASHYGDKPAQEWALLFQRILSNTILDWFRRQKSRQNLFSSLQVLPHGGAQEEDFEGLEIEAGNSQDSWAQSAEVQVQQWQTLAQIEQAIGTLPARQREAFLLRYWEELDVAETAAVMGCTEGSVKTHCSRAVQALSQRLSAQGIKP